MRFRLIKDLLNSGHGDAKKRTLQSRWPNRLERCIRHATGKIRLSGISTILK